VVSACESQESSSEGTFGDRDGFRKALSSSSCDDSVLHLCFCLPVGVHSGCLIILYEVWSSVV
jgi:hypothetical protein